MPNVDLSRLTAIVRTCDRPKSIARLVRSVRRYYPQMRLLVADDSREPRPIAGADWVRLPRGAGVSAGRNAALARVRTPFFLLLEERHELVRRSRIAPLLELVATNAVDVAAGQCVRCQRRFGLITIRRADPGEATFEFAHDGLTVRTGRRSANSQFLSCELAHNFFVARTDRIRAMGGWDPQLVDEERLEFFVRAQRFGLQVGVAPQVVARRWVDGRADAPASERDLARLAMVKMGVSRLDDATGELRGRYAASKAA